MIEALAHTAEHERTTPEKLLERLRENGRDTLVREDIRMRKAIDLRRRVRQADPDRTGRGPRSGSGRRRRSSAEAGQAWAVDAGSRLTRRRRSEACQTGRHDHETQETTFAERLLLQVEIEFTNTPGVRREHRRRHRRRTSQVASAAEDGLRRPHRPRRGPAPDLRTRAGMCRASCRQASSSLHDPTQLNRQGPRVRATSSARPIFFATALEQEREAIAAKEQRPERAPRPGRHRDRPRPSRSGRAEDYH